MNHKHKKIIFLVLLYGENKISMSYVSCQCLSPGHSNVQEPIYAINIHTKSARLCIAIPARTIKDKTMFLPNCCFVVYTAFCSLAMYIQKGQIVQDFESFCLKPILLCIKDQSVSRFISLTACLPASQPNHHATIRGDNVRLYQSTKTSHRKICLLTSGQPLNHRQA